MYRLPCTLREVKLFEVEESILAPAGLCVGCQLVLAHYSDAVDVDVFRLEPSIGSVLAPNQRAPRPPSKGSCLEFGQEHAQPAHDCVSIPVVIRFLVSLVPPRLVRVIGRLQFRLPFLRFVLDKLRAVLIRSAGVIKHGEGAGLTFDARGGFAGYLLGTSEPEEQKAVVSFLEPGSVFFDIGANIGFFSTIAARAVGPKGRFYAFEPSENSAANAERNARLNGFDQVTVVRAAVCDKNGKAWLQTALPPDQHSLVSDRPAQGVEVETFSIDGFILETSAPLPDLVMIDVEGAEIEVLIGMHRTIERCKPIILCEVHWLGARFIDCYEKHLRPLGYGLTLLDGNPIPAGIERYHALLAVGD